MIVNLKHSQSGLAKQAKVGFSWTTLLFGLFVPLVRGDLKWTIIMLILSVITFGLAWLVFPFVYNKVYLRGLLESGYGPADDHSRASLNAAGLVVN